MKKSIPSENWLGYLLPEHIFNPLSKLMENKSYLVFARKYRPQNFDELIGQDVLVRTLKNSISNNKIHHAYILTGIRGVGKTSTARIIAKTINCENPQNNIACDLCTNCIKISNSSHPDVIEFDAASNTGVDDIRVIIDSISYKPIMSKYKVYIIDEVHMLSVNAFNALLKTLEEPPAHILFIFATTEIKKVPITIISRCQKFNLRRLKNLEIIDHLKFVAHKEGYEIEENALNLIAKKSDGSVRDSLSLLDQAISNNNFQKFLPFIVVQKMFGISDKIAIFNLLNAILNAEFAKSIEIFNNIYEETSDILQILTDLIEILHEVILIKKQVATISSEYESETKKIAEKVALSDLLRLFKMMTKGFQELSFSNFKKIEFEIFLTRICHLVALPDLKKILLESRVENKEVINKFNNVDINLENSGDELVNEIIRNFEGAKLINN